MGRAAIGHRALCLADRAPLRDRNEETRYRLWPPRNPLARLHAIPCPRTGKATGIALGFCTQRRWPQPLTRGTLATMPRRTTIATLPDYALEREAGAPAYVVCGVDEAG